MGIVLLVARLGLALVLGVAAVAKLAAPGRTRDSLRAFGASEGVVTPGAVVLPATELVAAALLAFTGTARAGAASALALLVLFTVAVARVLARGERPDCNCFGVLRSKPVGEITLLRNAGLGAVAAVLAVAGPGAGVQISLSGTDALVLGAVALVTCAIVAHGFFSYELFRQNGRLLERIAALEARADLTDGGRGQAGARAGQRAPAFVLPDLQGHPQSLADLLQSRRALALAFLDPDCGACGPALAELAGIRERRSEELAIAVLTRGDAADARRRINGYRFDSVLLQEGREVADAFGVSRVPSALVVDRNGRIASPVAVGVAAISTLLDVPSPSPEPATAGVS